MGVLLPRLVVQAHPRVITKLSSLHQGVSRAARRHRGSPSVQRCVRLSLGSTGAPAAAPRRSERASSF
jgi:hypothetical protein